MSEWGAGGPGVAILVIEDDPAIGDLLAELAREMGLGAVVASSLAEIPWDLVPAAIVTDLVCDRAHDPAAARSYLSDVRRRFPGVPVILVTAHAWPRSAALDVEAFVPKPFDIAELSARLVSLAPQARGLQARSN